MAAVQINLGLLHASGFFLAFLAVVALSWLKKTQEIKNVHDGVSFLNNR